MKHILYLIAMLILFSGCKKNEPTAIDPLPPSSSHFFSFENDMEGWNVSGTDLDKPPVEWSIQRTQEMAKDGNTSIRFYLVNYNDQGKIWIEQFLVVKPDQLYQVTVKYAFASADFGDINHWTIITGVVPKQVQTAQELVYQGETGNGSESMVGYKWLEKNYNLSVRSSSEGVLYVIIGVWGTWETARTYYLDSVRIDLTEK